MSYYSAKNSLSLYHCLITFIYRFWDIKNTTAISSAINTVRIGYPPKKEFKKVLKKQIDNNRKIRKIISYNRKNSHSVYSQYRALRNWEKIWFLWFTGRNSNILNYYRNFAFTHLGSTLCGHFTILEFNLLPNEYKCDFYKKKLYRNSFLSFQSN